jgi:ferredoxin
MGSRFIVTVDEQGCGLCQVCARHCPTGALRAEPEGEVLRLVFRPALCTGCPDRAADRCDARCTERALRLASEEADRPQSIVLIEDELLRCQVCGRPFAPGRKLRAVSNRRRRPAPLLMRERCPSCRQTQLVVRFIDEAVAVGAASYRSAREILRRAGHWRGR